MLGSFLFPFRHLALDNSWIDAVPPHLVIGALHLQLPQQTSIPLFQRLGSRAITFRQPALENLEAPQKGQPIRVQAHGRGGLKHQRASYEMPQRQRIDLLNHPCRRLAPQVRRLGRSPWVLVGLLLVVDQLLFPSLVIEHDQFFRGVLILIREISDQHMNFSVTDPLRVVQRIADHPDENPIAILLTVVGRPIDLGQIRTIGQVSDRLEDQPTLHSRQDLDISRRHFFPEVIAEKPAVPQQKHLGSQMAEQAADHGLLAVAAGPDHEGEFGVGPQLDQAELADLGEGPVATRPGRGPAEGRGVGVGVRDVVDGPIKPYQSESAVEGPRSLGPGQRMDDLLKEVANRGDAQALPGHAEAGPMGGLLAEAEPACVLEDLANRQLGQQSHDQDNPADDFVGEFATSLIDAAGGREGLANGLGRDNLFQSRQSIQDPARLIGRQRALSLWHASHGLLATWVLSKPKIAGGCDLRLFQRYWALGVDLTLIEGIDVGTALVILGEIGVDVSRFPTEKHFASWLRLCPPQNESNKTNRRRGHRKATNRVTIALRMCARSVGQTTAPLGLFYRRIRSRIGGLGAVKATAHKFACLVYRMLKYGQEYVTQSMEEHEAKVKANMLKALKRKAMAMGFQLSPLPTQ